MSDPERSQALLSADDDMGPDFADEFTDTPWLKIPDVITNRIDLRPYMKQQPDRRSMMHTRSLIRGIKSRVHKMLMQQNLLKHILQRQWLKT